HGADHPRQRLTGPTLRRARVTGSTELEHGAAPPSRPTLDAGGEEAAAPNVTHHGTHLDGCRGEEAGAHARHLGPEGAVAWPAVTGAVSAGGGDEVCAAADLLVDARRAPTHELARRAVAGDHLDDGRREGRAPPL